ncbi:MAG TPA: pyridoxal phosphate-dependent aminotransferase [Acidobacteriota bacterium]|nr:pyridoxal phosphate-dependent aminotransferase [Acidobacteriota bacterium]
MAERVKPFQESVIREMTRLGDETGAVNLSQGLPDFDPPQEILDAAKQAIDGKKNQYTFPFGSLAFREAVAKKTSEYNKIPTDPEEEVTVTCGVSEALMVSMLALTDPGDEVIIFEPWYENYVPDCFMAGVKPVFFEQELPDYEIDFDKLEKLISSRTRLVIINTPQNPNGKVFSEKELLKIANLCEKHNLIAVSDEIYEHITYDSYQHISPASIDGMKGQAVTISGLGKTYSVTGWRVGWIVAAPELTRPMRKVHDYLTVCAPAPFQAAGIKALELPTGYYKHMKKEYKERRKLLLNVLDEVGMGYYKPNGAYYVMADFSHMDWDGESYARDDWTEDRAFAEYMAREIKVAVVPGSSFYAGEDKGTTQVRFNFAKKMSTLKEAVQRLKKLKKKS